VSQLAATNCPNYMATALTADHSENTKEKNQKIAKSNRLQATHAERPETLKNVATSITLYILSDK